MANSHSSSRSRTRRVIENEKISAADIRKAVDGIPTDYANQREIGSALSQTVEALKGIGLCLFAAFALTASALEWQDVPAETVIGEGLTITNGEICVTASNDRFVTDIDGAGHSITNSPMATTNFVWEVVGSVTNNLPSGGGIDGEAVTNIVEGVVADATNAIPCGVAIDLRGDGSETVRDAALSGTAYTEWSAYGELPDGRMTYGLSLMFDEIAQHEAFSGRYPARTNIPALPASATVGELVDAINAVATALRKEEP